MSGTQFAMVSEWMPNGNIDQYVKAHRDANRYELVSSPFEFILSSAGVDDYTTSVVGRCCEGLDLHA